MLLEFVGAIVFGLTVASLTSVVTSIDINARKTAEELDAVSSFVANRNFPEPLGRRIRRHFRHFYSMKSAIDESKIFGELSTTLRRDWWVPVCVQKDIKDKHSKVRAETIVNPLVQ